MEDEKIIELFFARQEEAIAAARETYGGYCAGVARNILSSEEDVEEILSDTWMKLWNSIPPQKPGNLKLYIARIARNLSFDRMRSLTREKRGGGELPLALDELAECIPSPGQPEERLEAEQLKRAVNAFLGTLPKRDRGMFLMRYFYVETTEQIAERFNVRPALVRTVLSRTRKKLKACLIKEGLL